MDTTLTQERIDFLARDYCRGFIKYCGLQALEVKKGSFESQVLISDNHRTQDNFIHAGLMATMADHTAGYSAFTTVSENYRILTIEFKINYFKLAVGELMICRSKIINNGRKIKVSESEVFSVSEGQEKLISKAMVTLIAVPAENLA